MGQILMLEISTISNLDIMVSKKVFHLLSKLKITLYCVEIGNNINILDMLSSSGGDTNGFPALWREFEPLKVKSKMKNASSDLKQGIKNLHERQEKIDTLNDTVESMNSSAHEYASLALAAKKVILLQRLGKPGKKKFTL